MHSEWTGEGPGGLVVCLGVSHASVHLCACVHVYICAC